MPRSLANALAEAMEKLESQGISSARLDATLLLSHVTGMSRADLFLKGMRDITSHEEQQLGELLQRRLNHEPLAYILSHKEFWSLDFLVTRDTLIPRPDSETLIEASLERMERAAHVNILDIGTGTGCLLISLLTELPRASGVGLDCSKQALKVAQENARRHGVDERSQFLESHWCDAIDRTFDLIISNPPYIAETDKSALMPDVVQFEPHSALFAGTDGLDAYRELAPQMKHVLAPGGLIVWEVGQGQAKEVGQLLAEQGLWVEQPKNDLAGIPRAVIARKHHN